MAGVRIAVIGASGWLGGAIAREALARGHEVTAIGRDRAKLDAVVGARPATVDATDAQALPSVIAAAMTSSSRRSPIAADPTAA